MRKQLLSGIGIFLLGTSLLLTSTKECYAGQPVKYIDNIQPMIIAVLSTLIADVINNLATLSEETLQNLIMGPSGDMSGGKKVASSGGGSSGGSSSNASSSNGSSSGNSSSTSTGSASTGSSTGGSASGTTAGSTTIETGSSVPGEGFVTAETASSVSPTGYLFGNVAEAGTPQKPLVDLTSYGLSEDQLGNPSAAKNLLNKNFVISNEKGGNAASQTSLKKVYDNLVQVIYDAGSSAMSDSLNMMAVSTEYNKTKEEAVELIKKPINIREDIQVWTGMTLGMNTNMNLLLASEATSAGLNSAIVLQDATSAKAFGEELK